MLKQRYLAYVLFTDDRLIRGQIEVCVKGLQAKKARTRAHGYFRHEQRSHPGRRMAIFEATAITDGKKVKFNGQASNNTRSHENVHLQVAEKLNLTRRWVTDPLEESVAYAIEHTASISDRKQHNDSTKTKIHGYASSGLKFIQALAHDLDDEYFDRIVNETGANAIKADRLVNALDNAANYMFYRECMAILERFGLETGAEILLEALTIANKHDLQSAWEFIAAHLDRNVLADLVRKVQLPDLPFTIVSPYCPRYKAYEMELC